MLLFLLACTKAPGDTGDCSELLYRDADGDGFGVDTQWAVACPGEGWAVEPGDCDDADATEHPSAEPPCSCLLGDEWRSWYEDVDGDGYGVGEAIEQCAGPDGTASAAGDCDPDDPSSHPGADELWYDGIDQDCDGASDYDADADGFDAAEHGGSDCDDGDAAINPEAYEFCDAERLDEDCDGLANEDDPDARGYRRWYPDGDGDGHGTEGDSVFACSPPEGYADGIDDCDDDDASVNPSADEICGNEVDEDCNTASLTCGARDTVELAWSEIRYTSEESFYQAMSVASGDVDGDGQDELVFGVPYWSSDVSGYASRIVLADADEGGSVEDMTWLDGGLDTYAGLALDVGDVDADGFDDLLVSRSFEEGTVLLLHGPLSGPISAGATLQIEGRLGDANGFGSAVDVVEDVDGDGLPDLSIANPNSSWEASYQGEVHLFSGVETGTTDVYDAYATAGGAAANERLSRGVVGDLDGDGTPEWVLSAPYSSAGPGNTGRLYVLPLDASGTLDVEDSIQLIGMTSGGQLGSTVVLSDVDDDGELDLIIAAPSGGDGGHVFVVDELPEENMVAGDVAVAKITMDSPYGALGRSLVAPGDLDGDGVGDLALGAPEARPDSQRVGSAYLLSNVVEGSVIVSDVAWATLVGADDWDYAGMRMTEVEDVTGDGLPELLIQSPTTTGFGTIDLIPGGPGQ